MLAPIMGLFTRNLSVHRCAFRRAWSESVEMDGECNNAAAAKTPFLLERHFEFQPLDTLAPKTPSFSLVSHFWLLNWITITYRLSWLAQVLIQAGATELVARFQTMSRIIASSVA